MKRITALFLTVSFLFSLQAPVFAKKKQELSVLDKRAIQIKTYDTKSEDELMKIALNLFQNEEYELKNIDDELSILTGKGEYRQPRPWYVKTGWVLTGLAITGATFGIYAPIGFFYIKDGCSPYIIEREVTLNVTNLNNKENKIRLVAYDKRFQPYSLVPAKRMLNKIEETDL